MAAIGYACLMNPLNPKKLLRTKWTAIEPVNKEKHFMVNAVVAPEQPGLPVEFVDLEALHSGTVRRISWRALRDDTQWRQGWC
jgi:tryptophan-rich hypothetical protein